MLQIRNFKKSYGGLSALEIDNLVIGNGIYWIKGINGSGKSTFLKSAAGITSFKGDILLNDTVSLHKHPVAYRRLVNFGDAEPVFPPFLKGTDLLKLFGAAKKADAGQEEKFIESMQMTDFIRQPIRTYSSGMLKKLSLMMAFQGHPSLILLDEPLITLDKKSVEILTSLIAESYINEGINFMITSHQLLDTSFFPDLKALQVVDKTLKFLG